jgi:transitional endoplasmic reticulum ATPase
MPITFRLDHVIDKIADYDRSAQQRIKRLSGRTLSASEASAVWPRILEHKWYISERLGRDTGLKVAAIDYLENIYNAPKQTSHSLPAKWSVMHPLTRAA